MDRIVVVGCGGAGKSTLARRLGRHLDLPVTHLDAIYYGPEWRPLGHEEFAARQERIVARDRWLIDGNYLSTLPIRLAAADTVIFLDLPAYVCLWGIARRRLRRRGHRHGDSEVHHVTWSFIGYVVGYRRAMRPRVIALVAAHAGSVRHITVTSRREANRIVPSLISRI